MSRSSSLVSSLFEIQEHLHELLEQEANLSSRRYMVPVVVEGRLFSSMTDAARWLSWHRPDLWVNSKAAQEKDAYRVMCNLIKRVSRWCSSYRLDDWFLAEDGDPETWNVSPGKDGEDEFLIEDLRRK